MLSVKNIKVIEELGVSVSLRSIIHSYEIVKEFDNSLATELFPSPYGVSFILMCVSHL